MIALSFGGGTDSTAVIGGWVEKGYQETTPINLILFADTGGEKPHTYEHIERMNGWLQAKGMPEVTVVRKGGIPESLEENCLRLNTLPSIAYGFKKCSHRFKIEPMEKFINNYPEARKTWATGGKVVKLVGYDYSEKRRLARAITDDPKYVYRFPLAEWEWSRPECIEAIKRMGLPLPGKSACFFCPSSKKAEIDELRRTHPDLYERAIRIEDNARAGLKSVKGLGRAFSWRDYTTTDKEADVQTCMTCIDGE